MQSFPATCGTHDSLAKILALSSVNEAIGYVCMRFLNGMQDCVCVHVRVHVGVGGTRFSSELKEI